jgi:hypothetical protein
MGLHYSILQKRSQFIFIAVAQRIVVVPQGAGPRCEPRASLAAG